jgi:hypothetical protein
MPFEGAGVISAWRLEHPQHKKFRQSKLESITDVFIQLIYTSLDGRERRKADTMSAVQTYVKYMDYKSSSGGLSALFENKQSKNGFGRVDSIGAHTRRKGCD